MKKLTLLLILALSLLNSKPALASIDVSEIVSRVNYERQIMGLPKLSINPLLNVSATSKAQSILKSQTFQHTINQREFESWIEEVGYNYELVGENLAIDFFDSPELIAGWMNSQTHKNNILHSDFTETGLGIVSGVVNGVQTTIVVQHFGRPSDKIVDDIKTVSENFQERSMNLPTVGLGATLIATGTSMGYITNLINRKRKTSN